MALPSQQYLRECFCYNEQTGALVWKERPISHFANEHTKMIINKRHMGKHAGTSKKRFAHVRLLGKYFSTSQIIWKWVTGADPIGPITCVDNDNNNLKFENLKIKYVKSLNQKGEEL